MKTITVCTSVSFYKQALKVQEDLEKMGYKVIVPSTAHIMKANNDYDVSHYKTWYENKDHYDRKASLMREHFAAIEKADAILILNLEKNKHPNYIGGNVLMEMAIAFHLKMPIFLTNDIPEHSPFLEEIVGMESVPLHGKLAGIKRLFPAS